MVLRAFRAEPEPAPSQLREAGGPSSLVAQMDRIGAVWIEEGDSSVTFRVRSRRMLLRYTGWALLALGVVLLARDAGDSAFFTGMFVFIVGMVVDFAEMLLATTRKVRGCITPIDRLTIQRGGKAKGYREAPTGPTLEAAGRHWPLEDVRRLDIGYRVMHDRHGKTEAYTTYVVLPDRVLLLTTTPHEADAKQLVARLRQAIDPKLDVAAGGDREPLSAALGVGILTGVLGMTAIPILLVGILAGWMHRFAAIALAVLTVLIMRLIISNLGADEEKLARYAATRFGVEPASDDD